MKVIRCNSTHDAAWNAFVNTSPQASFYHRAEWRSVNEQSLGLKTCYLAAVQDDCMVGVMPIVWLRSRLVGNLACSMPFVNYGGPAAETSEIEQLLLRAAAEVAGEWGVDYLEVRSQRDLGEQYPSAQHKVSMTISLDPDPEIQMSRMKREHRGEIRRAAKRGFVTRFGLDLVDDFYTVLSESWRDLGTPIFDVAYLKAVIRALPNDSRICVVYDAAGVPAAGAFLGIHNGTVEGMWLGMRASYRQQLVGYVLYWDLIKHSCELGAKAFHLGRSTKDSGGEQFKKKWNAETLQLHWHYILFNATEIPTLNTSNPKFQFAIKVWQRLPVTVTKVIGPFIAKNIP
jgi:FemAB-related protein (PEP-CTERM system-associated)